MSKKSENEDGVGYGRPPKGSQFPKGQSGNPAGRPKGARNLRPRNWEERLTDLIQAETEREVTIRENGTPVTLTVIQAIIKSLSVAAIKGSVKAQALVIDMTRTAASARTVKALPAVHNLGTTLSRPVRREKPPAPQR